MPAVLLPEEKEWPTKCIQSVTKLEVLKPGFGGDYHVDGGKLRNERDAMLYIN